MADTLKKCCPFVYDLYLLLLLMDRVSFGWRKITFSGHRGIIGGSQASDTTKTWLFTRVAYYKKGPENNKYIINKRKESLFVLTQKRYDILTTCHNQTWEKNK